MNKRLHLGSYNLDIWAMQVKQVMQVSLWVSELCSGSSFPDYQTFVAGAALSTACHSLKSDEYFFANFYNWMVTPGKL